MTRHTSGPWTAHSTKSFYVFGPASLSEQAGLDYGPFVCNASTQANARLISAAPELLACLLDCEKNMLISTPDDMARLDRIRYVIAKATGEKS